MKQDKFPKINLLKETKSVYLGHSRTKKIVPLYMQAQNSPTKTSQSYIEYTPVSEHISLMIVDLIKDYASLDPQKLVLLKAMFANKEGKLSNHAEYIHMLHTSIVKLVGIVLDLNKDLEKFIFYKEKIHRDNKRLNLHLKNLESKLSLQTNENIKLMTKVDSLSKDINILKNNPEFVILEDMRKIQHFKDLEKELSYKNNILAQLRQEVNSYQKKNIKINKLKKALEKRGIEPDSVLHESHSNETSPEKPKKPTCVPFLSLSQIHLAEFNEMSSNWSQLSINSETLTDN